MKITKRIEWLTPFIEKAQKYIPINKKLERVTALRLQSDKNLFHYGCCLTANKRTYSITLHTHYWRNRFFPFPERDKKKFSKIDILQTLAHEIAHITHWEHTPEHKILEGKICADFMKLLKKQGYKSEEKELS